MIESTQPCETGSKILTPKTFDAGPKSAQSKRRIKPLLMPDPIGAVRNQSLFHASAHVTSYPMLAAIRSAAVLGIEAYDVIVEVDVAAGLPAWTIVGFASSAVKEARERVSAALTNSGFTLPSRRVTVNLSPASSAKE